MRSAYNHLFDYRYNYQLGGEEFAMTALLGIWLLFLGAVILVTIVNYVLASIGLYSIGKRMGKQNAWLAFVPFARTYFHGNLAGSIQLKNTTIKNPGLWKLILPYVYSIGSSMMFMGVFVMVLFGITGSVISGNAFGAGISFIAFIGIYALVIIISILFMAVLQTLRILINKQIFGMFGNGNMHLIHSLLSAFIPLYEPIYLFILRNKPFITEKTEL